jgi:prolyl-tRNA synthetase
VLLPIYRNDDERAAVLKYCQALQADLCKVSYADHPLRVHLDDRDMRGGDKAWQHIKKGVPLRVEIGPRDLASDSVFVGRRDRAPKEKTSVPRAQFIAEVAQILRDMQDGLFQRASAIRDAHTHHVDSLAEFREFFTPRDEKNPEIHGGFALCHWADDPQVDEILQPLKVTLRCIPIHGDDEPGKCVFTGRPSRRRVVFAKAY